MKKIFCIIAVFCLAITCFIIPASAEDVSSLNESDYAEIRFPSWAEFEELRDTLPSGIDTYNLDSHFLIYSASNVYDHNTGGIDYTNYAKLYCYAFDSDFVSKLYTSGQSIQWISWDSSVDTSSANLYVYYYDFVRDKWVYEKTLDYSMRRTGVRGSDAVLYTDCDVQLGITESTAPTLEAGTINYLTPTTWQSLTWEELKVIPSNMVSEIIGILPVLLSFLVLSLAIHKGVSFLLGFIRSV